MDHVVLVLFENRSLDNMPKGQMDFTFDRSGYRTPAIIVSPWIDEGMVINDEYRHTSMIATLRKVWNLGDAFTERDAAAPFDHLLDRETPRDPSSWPDVEPRPVPEYHMDMELMNKAVGSLGKAISAGTLEHAKKARPTRTRLRRLRNSSSVAHLIFPRLAPDK